MTTSLIDADSLLVLDVGEIKTRAILFDVVEGRYRYLASGYSTTTAGAPFNNVGEGVRLALNDLEAITGRKLLGQDGRLLMPSLQDGSGVDTFSAIISAGPPLKIVAVGLLDGISLDSARRIAASTYGQVDEVIGLNDQRKMEERIDAILQLRPDLIIIAGGTENGAVHSVNRLVDFVSLTCRLLPESQRPEVLFAGNQAMRDEIEAKLASTVNLHFAANIRPSIEDEELDSALNQIAKITTTIRARQFKGVDMLESWSHGGLLPAATAFGRIIRFLSETHPTKKGVLGVELGSSATTIATAFAGRLTLGVYPQFCQRNNLATLSNRTILESITRWLFIDIPDNTILEYMMNKCLYPASIPITQEELAIEQAINRHLLRNAIDAIIAGFPREAVSVGKGYLPWIEPIIATGEILTQASTYAQCVMMLLDGLQPTGTTTLILDQNQLSSALGAAAGINPALVVQILDSNAFLHLGTVISPVGKARPGTPILRLKIAYDNGQTTNLDVLQGTFEVIPLAPGQSARLQLQPLHLFDVGMGAPGRGGNLKVTGGIFGVIIDARGRPLRLPEQPNKRLELMNKWLWNLGG